MFPLVSFNLNRSRCKLLHKPENTAGSTTNNNTWLHGHHLFHFISFAFCCVCSFTSIILILRITSYWFFKHYLYRFCDGDKLYFCEIETKVYITFVFASSCISVNDVLLIIIIIIIIIATIYPLASLIYKLNTLLVCDNVTPRLMPLMFLSTPYLLYFRDQIMYLFIPYRLCTVINKYCDVTFLFLPISVWLTASKLFLKFSQLYS